LYHKTRRKLRPTLAATTPQPEVLKRNSGKAVVPISAQHVMGCGSRAACRQHRRQPRGNST
jgi:hypothetical protein